MVLLLLEKITRFQKTLPNFNFRFDKRSTLFCQLIGYRRRSCAQTQAMLWVGIRPLLNHEEPQRFNIRVHGPGPRQRAGLYTRQMLASFSACTQQQLPCGRYKSRQSTPRLEIPPGARSLWEKGQTEKQGEGTDGGRKRCR